MFSRVELDWRLVVDRYRRVSEGHVNALSEKHRHDIVKDMEESRIGLQWKQSDVQDYVAGLRKRLGSRAEREPEDCLLLWLRRLRNAADGANEATWNDTVGRIKHLVKDVENMELAYYDIFEWELKQPST